MREMQKRRRDKAHAEGCERYAYHVQAEIGRNPELADPSYGWCLWQVERHLGYVEAGGADTDEKRMAALVLVISPLARKRG